MEVQVRKSAVTALTFPEDDPVFAERVREALAGASGDIDATLSYIKRRLAAVHPRVDVRLRSNLAGFGEMPVAYVFRDGTALPRASGDWWIHDPATALAVTDGDGVYLDANEAAATLFGVRRDDIIGKPAGTFTTPDARIADADALWRALRDGGRLHSLAVVRRSDGTDVAVEFITIRDGAGEDRNLTLIRSLAAT